jgi:hypothetical protein
MSVSLCTGAGDGGTQDMAVGRDQDASSTRGNHTEYRKHGWRERETRPPPAAGPSGRVKTQGAHSCTGEVPARWHL